MITVETRERIRRAYFIDHQSIRQIARELHCSRHSVDKAIASAEPATYTLSTPRPAPALAASHRPAPGAASPRPEPRAA